MSTIQLGDTNLTQFNSKARKDAQREPDTGSLSAMKPQNDETDHR